MKFTTVNPNLYVILIEVRVSYDNDLAELEELFLLCEDFGRRSPMDDLVWNGHEGGHKLRVPTQTKYFSTWDIPVKVEILLLVRREHMKVHTLKLFDMGIWE